MHRAIENQLVKQGIAELQQGNWKTGLNQFAQVLQRHAGSIQVCVNPAMLMDSNHCDITITIRIDEQTDLRKESTICIQDSLTNYQSQNNESKLSPSPSLKLSEPETLDFLEVER